MGMVAIFVIWPRSFEQTFIPPSYWGSIMKFGFDLAQQFLRRCLKSVDNAWRIDNDGWTTEPAYTISSPMSLKAQVS